MCVIHTKVSFFPRGQPSYAIAYSAFGIGELQDVWRARMDPLCDPLRPTGTTYEIKQVQ
jgi:hypothetical protein